MMIHFTNGFVDIKDNFYKQNTILLPEKLIVHKQIPSIEVNNHQYHNCLNIIFETVTPLRKKA